MPRKSYKSKLFGSSLFLSIFLPVLLFADFSLENSTFGTVIDYLLEIINLLIPVMIGIAFLVFFWGLSIFILKDSGNEKTRAEGKKKMLWGIAGLFVLLTFKTIVSLISSDLGFGNGTIVPQLRQPTPSSTP